MAPPTPHSPHGAISDSRLHGTRLTPATAATRHARSTGDLFRCPELDQRMKSYLVRLAQETATHLVRDSLSPRSAPSRIRLDSDVPPEGEGERLPEVVWTPTGNAKGVAMLRGASETKDACCMRGSVDVNASIEEFALLFKMDSKRELAEHGLLFNPDILDMATLYALVQPSGDQPRRYVGIKWCLLQGPSKLFHNRDLCFLECQKEFRDPMGRRGWVRSMHSIKLPCCPSFHKSHGIVRASLYRCGLVAVESSKPGVLEVTYTLEMDLKGHFPDMLQTNFLSQRIAALGAVDRCLQQQRLSSSPLLGDLEINREKLQNRACHYCYRGFSTFSKRHMCRRCSECVCKHCSDDWHLDIPVIGRQKVRICTVCSAEARFSHTTPEATRGTARRATIASLQNSRGASARRETAAGAGMLGPPRVTEQRRKTYGALTRTPKSNRSQSAAASRATQQYSEQEFYDYESTEHQDYGRIQPSHMRGTTDLSNMWEPQDVQSAMASPSPSSYFPVQPPSFSAEPVTPSAARPSNGIRSSRHDRDTMPFRMEDMQRPSSIANAPPQQPTVQIWERPSRTPRSYQPPSPAPVHHQFQQYQQEPPRQSYRHERVPATPPPQRVSSYHLESLHHRNRAFSDSDSWEAASNSNSSTRGGRSIAHQVLARQREKKLRAKSVERHDAPSREAAQPSPAARPQPIVPNFFRGATFGMTRTNTDKNNANGNQQKPPVDAYQDQDLQQNGPPSPVPSAESVEYVETENGEWIPGKWSKGTRRNDNTESDSSPKNHQLELPGFDSRTSNNGRKTDMYPLKNPFGELASDPAAETDLFQNNTDEDDGYTTSRRTFPSLLVDDGEPMMVPLHMDHHVLAYQPTRAS